MISTDIEIDTKQELTEVPSQNLWLAFHAAGYCPLRMGRIGVGVKRFLLKDQNL